jgi:hypothetical protein
VERLRNAYILDPSYSVPADCLDPLTHFLLESQRGPDYQFASAAAILLRVLGYPTRLVSGFYAHPNHFDPETKHTPVAKEDIHFWPEVMLPSGDWLVIEPTPSYEILGPNVLLSERIGQAAMAFARWVGRHAFVVVSVLFILIAVYFRRRRLFDAVATRLWLWFPGRTWRDQVRRAVVLLERRGRWAGKPRTPGQTVATWMQAAIPKSTNPEVDAGQLVHMVEWASYAPDVSPPWPACEALAVCRRVLDVWTLRRWRLVTFPNAATGAQQ